MTTPPPPPRIRACLFDMDGLLINSEDAYTTCTNIVLARYSRPPLPWHIKAQLQGRPGGAAAALFQKWAQLPCSSDEYMAQTAALQREHFPHCEALPGVPELLGRLRDAKTPIALATSSNKTNFSLKTAHLSQLFDVFAQENRVLGDDARVPAGRGKPAPDIYLVALGTVNESLRARGEKGDIKPAECLVFEDSVPGVEAGRRAGMQVVWVPHEGLLKEYKGREKEVLAGLCGEEGTGEVKPVGDLDGEGVTEKPGRVDDGWAVRLGSLEEFPYGRYGLGGA